MTFWEQKSHGILFNKKGLMSHHYFFTAKVHKFKKNCCYDCCHDHVLVNFSTLPCYYKYVICVWSVIISVI